MITRIYNGLANPANINNTDSLKGASAVFMITPDSVREWEIDFYLQVEVSANNNRLVKLNESFILDTVMIYPIPQELQFTGLNFYGAFVVTTQINCEIWGVYAELTLETIYNKILELQQIQQEDFRLNVAQAINAIAQNTSLELLSASLSPLTLGASATAIPTLTSGTSILLPFTGLFLP